MERFLDLPKEDGNCAKYRQAAIELMIQNGGNFAARYCDDAILRYAATRAISGNTFTPGIPLWKKRA
jgi:hypothetical protein